MVPTNDFLPFATGGSANVESQASYAVDTLRTNGNQPGVAVSAFNNKAIRQAAWIASVLAQFIANSSGLDVLDDANETNLLNAMALAWPNSTLPTVTYLTVTGATAGYLFTCSTANATVGAVYANNGHNYTVLSTLASGTLFFCSGASAPLSSGTLTKQSGTGDSTITFSAIQALATYTTPANCKYLKVKMAGAGGGGGGAGTSLSGGAGGNGAPSLFGSNLLLCFGGKGAPAYGSVVGTGGSATVNSPALQMLVLAGGTASYVSGLNSDGNVAGGMGGTNPLGGAGGSGQPQVNATVAAGQPAAANTGAGGGGASPESGSQSAGGGGAAGGYIEALIPSPASTYYYAVGAGGTGGTAGTSGGVGGAGGSGVISIEEHYTA